jgi:phosphatidylserine/phosphatidylglycerophosphate/cardiolipin synthase-like enzyme
MLFHCSKQHIENSLLAFLLTVFVLRETDSPVLFAGSANMSKSSVNGNDENLLEIKRSRPVAAIYLAEFMRLYEHYRARAAWRQYVSKNYDGYSLAPDASWAKRHFQKGSPEWRNRMAMIAAL